LVAEEASATLAIRIAAGTPDTVKELILEKIQEAGEEFEVEFTEGYAPVDIDHDVEGESPSAMQEDSE
jgi:acetylornithine deacetylase